MKRNLFLLTLLLLALLCSGCGPDPEALQSETPAPEAVQVPDHPAAQRMDALKKRDITTLEPETMDVKLLVEAVNAAAAHPAEAEAPEVPGLWTVSLTLAEEPRTLELSAGLEAELVTATLPDPAGDLVYRVRDGELYELVRHSADVTAQVDQKAAETHALLLERTMKDALAYYADDPAGYTDWAYTVLTPEAVFDPGDGTLVQFYDFHYCLTAAHPEQVRLVGAMFLDGDLRVHDVSPTGWLASRTRDGEPAGADFLGFSFYWDPEDPTCLDALDSILDRAERNAGLTVRVDYLDQAPAQDYDYFQDEVTDYNQELLFRADRPVTDFRFFAVEYGTEAQGYEPREGAALYSQAQLDPARPLVINTNFPGDMPYRGFSFAEDGARKAYTLSTSGRDGSLVVAPIPAPAE